MCIDFFKLKEIAYRENIVSKYFHYQNCQFFDDNKIHIFECAYCL